MQQFMAWAGQALGVARVVVGALLLALIARAAFVRLGVQPGSVMDLAYLAGAFWLASRGI